MRVSRGQKLLLKFYHFGNDRIRGLFLDRYVKWYSRTRKTYINIVIEKNM